MAKRSFSKAPPMRYRRSTDGEATSLQSPAHAVPAGRWWRGEGATGRRRTRFSSMKFAIGRRWLSVSRSNFRGRRSLCGPPTTASPRALFRGISNQDSMKLRSYLLLAAISAVLLGAGRAETSRRPRYGGTLRVEIGAVIHSLDPAESPADPEEAAAKDEIGALLYDQRNPDGSFVGVGGSGAFHIAQWESGKRLTLAADDSYRGGRAFVDAIEIE